MEIVGLERFAHLYPGQLSGGMKQRVAIACVLADDANILLIDELFGALDALTREQLQRELLHLWLRTSVTAIFVTFGRRGRIAGGPGHRHERGSGPMESDIMIDLPRPRDVSSAEFNVVRRDVARQLTSHLVPRRAVASAEG
jgi:ABC-type nitrate/sulfonate/bicarbonate transport system ATPase subunit